MERRTWAALVVSAAVALLAGTARADQVPDVKIASGASIRRQSADGSLTRDDQARLGALGLRKMHSAAIAIHKIPRSDRQVARLRALVRAVGSFAPSEACDGIVSQGEGVGLCTGSVDGPFGKVPVRMPVSAKLTESESGALRVVITNHRAMEAKPLLGWSEVVAPGHLKVVYEMFPTDDGWLVYTRVGVEMSAHEGSAKTISDAMLKLEGWLTRELAKA